MFSVGMKDFNRLRRLLITPKSKHFSTGSPSCLPQHNSSAIPGFFDKPDCAYVDLLNTIKLQNRDFLKMIRIAVSSSLQNYGLTKRATQCGLTSRLPYRSDCTYVSWRMGAAKDDYQVVIRREITLVTWKSNGATLETTRTFRLPVLLIEIVVLGDIQDQWQSR